MRVRARADSGRDCAENSVATERFPAAAGVDCAKPGDAKAEASVAVPIAATMTVIVRVIFSSSR
jgi:hypothetical protein